MARTDSTDLQRTPLYDLHVRLGARMVPFAGYAMPVQYTSGIIKEHLHTRADAGLFDVSHMGQIALRHRSGRMEDAARALETLLPSDILELGIGRQRYSLFTNAEGGVLDDLMVSNLGDHFRLVVNASRKRSDEAHLRAHLADTCLIEPLGEQALVALQGPKAEDVLASISSEVRSLRFMDARRLTLLGEQCVVSRSGYTGEDGFEISVSAAVAEVLWNRLLQDKAVAPVGLGARDTLRLEAGLCLYGSDISEETTPVEAALEWTIPKARRRGGARAGGFPGAEKVMRQLESGPVRRRVGLRPQTRALVRGGVRLFRTESEATPIGVVTSGGFAPSLNAPVAMGYVPAAATSGAQLFAEVRERRLSVMVSRLPFISTHYRC